VERQDVATDELVDQELIRRFIVVAEELNFTGPQHAWAWPSRREQMPRGAGQSDPGAAAYWSGTDTPAPARSQDDHPPGPEINDISQPRVR